MQSEITDLAQLTVPDSEQLNADDLIGGARIFTISRISRGRPGKAKGSQPMNIALVEFVRGPWRPCLTMRRVLMELWGPRPTEWADGARVELYRDASVTFGDDLVGGFRIARMSHLAEAEHLVIVTTARGRRTTYRIGRLAAQSRPTADLATVLTDAELTEGDIDRWRASDGRPPVATLTDEQRAQLAGWLAADPTRLAPIRALIPPPK